MYELAYYIMLVVAVAVFVKGVKEKIDFVNSGQPSAEPRTDNAARRLKYVVKDGLALVRLFARERKMGVAHFLVLWGFIILFVDIVAFTIYAAVPDAFRGAYVYFKYSMTASAVLFFAGLVVMVANRYLLRPSRFARKYDNARDDNLVLLVLFFAAVFGIALKEYFRFSPDFANSPLVHALWFAHAALILAFFALIPYTKLMHILAAPISIFTRSERKPGVMRPSPESEEYMGLVTRKDLTRRDLLASLACMRCGRCQDNCPAFNSKTSLSPMFLIQNIRHIDEIAKGKMPMAKPYEVQTETDGGVGEEVEEVLLLDTVLDMDAIWACTTCRACM